MIKKVIVTIFLATFIFTAGGIFVAGGYYVALYLNHIAFGILIIFFGGLLWVLPTMAWIFGNKKSTNPILNKYQKTNVKTMVRKQTHANQSKQRKNKNRRNKRNR